MVWLYILVQFKPLNYTIGFWTGYTIFSHLYTEGRCNLIPYRLYLTDNMEDIVVFLALKVFYSDNSSIGSEIELCIVQITFIDKPQLKIFSL